MLIETIKKDQLFHRKNRNKVVAEFLTTLLGEALMIGKNDGNRDTTDEEVVKVLKKFVKNAQEVKANLTEDDARYTLADAEIGVCDIYLPRQMGETELSLTIEGIIAENDLSSPRDMGVVMKELKSSFAGLYDGKLASRITKELLNNG